MSGVARYDRKIVDAVLAADRRGVRPIRISAIYGLSRGQVAGILHRLRGKPRPPAIVHIPITPRLWL